MSAPGAKYKLDGSRWTVLNGAHRQRYANYTPWLQVAPSGGEAHFAVTVISSGQAQ
jgi:hypothetical protein